MEHLIADLPRRFMLAGHHQPTPFYLTPDMFPGVPVSIASVDVSQWVGRGVAAPHTHDVPEIYLCLNRDVRVAVTMAGVEHVLDSPFAFYVPAQVEHCFVTLRADGEAYVLGILLEHLRPQPPTPEQGRTSR